MSLTIRVSSRASNSAPMPCFVTSSPKRISVRTTPLAMPAAIFGRFDPIEFAAMPVSRAPVLLAVGSCLARADEAVGGGGTARAEAPGLFERPDAHREAKMLRGERAHGADIDGVECVVDGERPARVAREGAVAPVLDDAERV